MPIKAPLTRAECEEGLNDVNAKMLANIRTAGIASLTPNRNTVIREKGDKVNVVKR
jgi:hypothetical protein